MENNKIYRVFNYWKPWKGTTAYYECPGCGKIYMHNFYNYCPHCGRHNIYTFDAVVGENCPPDYNPGFCDEVDNEICQRCWEDYLENFKGFTRWD